MRVGFAELHALSNFTFLRGASHPQELVAEAARLGYAALAITDECSLASAVRAHLEAKRLGFKLIIGSEFRLQDGPKLVLLATDRSGYSQLVSLITLARRAAEKGGYRLLRHQLETQALDHCLAIWLPDAEPDIETGAWLKRLFPARCWIGAELFLEGTDGQRLATLQALGERLEMPRVACNDVHMHRRERQPLQDTLTAIRLGRPLRNSATPCFPMRSAISGRSPSWPAFTRGICCKSHCASPGAAGFRWKSCAMSIRPNWCPRVTRPAAGCVS